METTGWFDGKPAKIRRSGGTTEIFYGGGLGQYPRRWSRAREGAGRSSR